MLAFALSGIYAIADGFFVGNALGDDALAAVNIAFPLTAFLQAVGTGIGMGGAIEYAIHAGSKHESRGKQYMGMSIVLLGGCSILFTVLFLLAGPRILGAFEEAAKQAEDIVRSARSAAELIRRNILLEKRRGLIADVLNGTVRALAALPDETYLPLLLRLSEAAARTGEGVLRLNARDLARPGTAALSRDLGGGRSIRLSEEPAAIDGGFLLEYGELEMNSSFSALLEEKRERLEDLLNRELFG